MNKKIILITTFVTTLLLLCMTLIRIDLLLTTPRSLNPLELANKRIVEKLPAAEHIPQQFDLAKLLMGFSKKQITEHKQLYQGYVNKRNEIAEQLESANRSKATNMTYSPFRGLKLGETFALNGDVLHRLYFQNLGGKNTTMGPKTQNLILKNFDSIEAFKQDLFATANSARGWAITAYTLDDGRLYNYLLDAHNQMVPILVIPLVVLDVYEHAYMIDFGIKRVPYLDVFWDNIDWDVVEHRAAFIDKYADLFNTYFQIPEESPSKK